MDMEGHSGKLKEASHSDPFAGFHFVSGAKTLFPAYTWLSFLLSFSLSGTTF
jgi:hypothetical protein